MHLFFSINRFIWSIFTNCIVAECIKNKWRKCMRYLPVYPVIMGKVTLLVVLTKKKTLISIQNFPVWGAELVEGSCSSLNSEAMPRDEDRTAAAAAAATTAATAGSARGANHLYDSQLYRYPDYTPLHRYCTMEELIYGAAQGGELC